MHANELLGLLGAITCGSGIYQLALDDVLSL